MPLEPAPDPSDATLAPRPAKPRTFASGRYTVVRVLGEGGQKVVYLVHDNVLDRDCALSMVRSALLEPEDLERLKREAQAMARLGSQPHVVTVFDFGDEDGTPYLVCEYVPGGDLRRELNAAAGPLSLWRAISIASDVAQALEAAHARGVVHRDLKPGNIWLGDQRNAKLGDFGLAFSLDRSRLTMPGTVMGTAAYLAPEQALGEPVTERSDLYALGCLLYEMVCGKPPFADTNPTAVIAQHINAPPAAPSSHQPDVPPALEELILRLLAKSPARRPANAAAVLEELRAIADSLRSPGAPAESETAEPEPAPAAPGFVGRTPEQEQLAAALERTATGAGSLIMVVGEPGIGKTRLLEQFAAHARVAGARVLTGRCYDGDWAPPFSPFVEAIKQHATATWPQRLRADLGPDAGVLARIVPVLHERLPNIAEPPAIPADGERYRLLEAVSDTLGRLAAERPLVLMLDDLHWADKGTIAMLQQVARTASTQPILLLGAYRDVELDRTHPLADALAGLRREKHFERIALRGLDGAEVAELLDAIAEQDVPAALSEAIARETDGNPFFIKEVLLHLVEEGKIVQSDGSWTSKLSIAEMGIPEGVREVIGRRLSRVSETCGRMLTVASALTAGFSWEVISAIAAADDAALLDAIDEALGAQLIVERERGRYDFTHALIRHTLYEELSTPRRVLLHGQIGEALERLYARDIEPHLAELAHHFYECASSGDIGKATEYARRAAEDATVRVAYDVAVTQLRRVVELISMQRGDERDLCRTLIALGEAHWNTGDMVESIESYESAVTIAKREDMHEELVKATIGYTGAPEYPVAGPGVVEKLQDAIAVVGDDDDDRGALAMLLARLELALAATDGTYTAPLGITDAMRILRSSVACHAPDGELGRTAIRLARASGDIRALSYVLRARSRVLWETEGHGTSEARAHVDELCEIADTHGVRDVSAWGKTWKLIGRLQAGDIEAADVLIAELVPLTHVMRQAVLTYWLESTAVGLILMRGELSEAERRASENFAAAQQARMPSAAVEFAIQLFAIRREQGRLGELEPLIKGYVERNPNAPLAKAALAVLYAVSDRLDDARELYTLFSEVEFESVARDQFRPITFALLAEVGAMLNEQAGAESLLVLLRPWGHLQLSVAGGCVLYGAGSRILGLLTATMQRYDDAERHFEDALVMNTRMGARPWVARTQLDYARMLRKRDAAGDAARARELLQQALATAQDIGMAKVAADCEALLL